MKNVAHQQAILYEFIKGIKKNDKRVVSWTKSAFEWYKQELASATLLMHPMKKAPLSLTTDNSNVTIEMTLEQFQQN